MRVGGWQTRKEKECNEKCLKMADSGATQRGRVLGVGCEEEERRREEEGEEASGQDAAERRPARTRSEASGSLRRNGGGSAASSEEPLSLSLLGCVTEFPPPAASYCVGKC